MICNRLLGGSIRDCDCRLPPWDREQGGGWLRCPPDARGILEPIAPTLTETIAELRTIVSKAVADGSWIDEPKPTVAGVGIRTRIKSAPFAEPMLTGELCQDCGAFAMVRTGTCLTCQVCGSTSGGCS
jgi:hypothetical protein